MRSLGKTRQTASLPYPFRRSRSCRNERRPETTRIRHYVAIIGGGKMNNKPSFSVSATIFLLILISPVGFGQKQSASETSYQKARKILVSGLQALGESESHSNLKNFTIVEKDI